MMVLVGIAAVVILAAAILSIMHATGREICGYEISEDSIEVFYWGLRVWRCSFADVVDVRPISFSELFISSGLRLINRPFGPYVFVRKKSGFVRRVVITPDDAQGFIALVRSRMAS
jgi:hypothetical protein